jgi:putative hydrolase of the HAD superfamily
LAIKAISFDFWHTLFTEQPGLFTLYQKRRWSLLADAVLTQRPVPHSELERACRIEAECHHRIWHEEHRTLDATERVTTILNHLDVALPDVALAGLVVGFEEGILEHPPVITKGAREVLSDLAKHYRLGIISDVGFSPGRVLKRVLATNGLLEVFDSLIFSDEAGRAKPHKEVFQATARSLGVSPKEIVHVGDLERTDIIGAKQAGFRAIRFTGVTPMEENETTVADFVTDDLTAIPRLVEMLD